MNSTNIIGYKSLKDIIDYSNSYIIYSHKLRVFDLIFVMILCCTILHYHIRVKRLESYIGMIIKDYYSVDECDDEDSDEEDEDSDEDSDEEEDELYDLILELQTKVDFNNKRLSRKIEGLENNYLRIYKDFCEENDTLSTKLKTVDNKIRQLNGKYSSLEVMIDELQDDDDTESDDDSSESDSESELDVEERTYNSINVQNYSDKSFAVYGDTKKFKEELKILGGKWAPRLSGGPGWIFSNNHREAVDKWFCEISEDN